MAAELQSKIQEIEELCYLLKKDDVPVTQWFKDASEALRDTDVFTALEFADDKEKKSANTPVVPQLFHLLRECLLNYRWSEALEVIKTIVNIPNDTSRTIWKVGNELFGMEAETNRDLMQQLFSQMRQVTDLNGKELVMEYTTYLLGIGDNTEAITIMQEVLKRHGRKSDRIDRDKYIEKMHKAYMGLLWYLEFKKCQKQYDEIDADQNSVLEILGDSLSQNPTDLKKQSLAMQIRNFKIKAITCFKELRGVSGVWDIVITKHAEILVSNKEILDALEVLKNYCDTNPESLNAHKYLYKFCVDHQLNQEQQMETLKVIAKLSPSDATVLELCTRLMKDGKPDICLQYLFTLLDYPCWQMAEKPWYMMSRCLKKLKAGSPADQEVVKSLWGLRKSWWPAYHFSKYAASSCQQNITVLYQRAVVACLLCGKDSEFVSEAIQYLSDEQIEALP